MSPRGRASYRLVDYSPGHCAPPPPPPAPCLTARCRYPGYDSADNISQFSRKRGTDVQYRIKDNFRSEGHVSEKRQPRSESRFSDLGTRIDVQNINNKKGFYNIQPNNEEWLYDATLVEHDRDRKWYWVQAERYLAPARRSPDAPPLELSHRLRRLAARLHKSAPHAHRYVQEVCGEVISRVVMPAAGMEQPPHALPPPPARFLPPPAPPVHTIYKTSSARAAGAAKQFKNNTPKQNIVTNTHIALNRSFSCKIKTNVEQKMDNGNSSKRIDFYRRSHCDFSSKEPPGCQAMERSVFLSAITRKPKDTDQEKSKDFDVRGSKFDSKEVSSDQGKILQNDNSRSLKKTNTNRSLNLVKNKSLEHKENINSNISKEKRVKSPLNSIENNLNDENNIDKNMKKTERQNNEFIKVTEQMKYKSIKNMEQQHGKILRDLDKGKNKIIKKGKSTKPGKEKRIEKVTDKIINSIERKKHKMIQNVDKKKEKITKISKRFAEKDASIEQEKDKVIKSIERAKKQFVNSINQEKLKFIQMSRSVIRGNYKNFEHVSSAKRRSFDQGRSLEGSTSSFSGKTPKEKHRMWHEFNTEDDCGCPPVLQGKMTPVERDWLMEGDTESLGEDWDAREKIKSGRVVGTAPSAAAVPASAWQAVCGCPRLPCVCRRALLPPAPLPRGAAPRSGYGAPALADAGERTRRARRLWARVHASLATPPPPPAAIAVLPPAPPAVCLGPCRVAAAADSRCDCSSALAAAPPRMMELSHVVMRLETKSAGSAGFQRRGRLFRRVEPPAPSMDAAVGAAAPERPLPAAPASPPSPHTHSGCNIDISSAPNDGKSAAAGRAAAGGRELEVDWSREVGIGSPVRTLSSFTSTMEVRPACRGQRAYSFTREPCTMKDYEDGWYRGPEPEWRVVWEPAERRGAWLRAHEPAPAAWGGAWGPGWGPSRGASRGYLPISHQYMSATDFRHYDTPAPSYILDETTKDKELEYRHRVQQPTIASFQSQHLPHKYAVLQVAKSFNGPAHNTPKKTTDGNFCLYTAKYTTAANTPNNIHFPNISGYRDHNDSTTVYNVRNPHQNPQMNPQYPQGSVMYNQMEPTQNPQYAQGSVMYNQMEPTQNPQYPQGSMMFNQMEPTQNPQYPQGPVMFSRMDTTQNPQHPQVSQMYNQMEPQNSQMNPQYGQGPLQYPQGNAQPSQSTSGYNAQGISHVCSRVPCNVCEGRQAPPDIIPCGPRQMTVAEIIEANSRCNLECMTKKPPPETNLNTNRTFKAKLDAMKAEEKALKKKKSKKSDVPFLKRIKYLLSGKAEERYTYHRPCYKYTRNAKTGKICIACNTNLPCECFYIQSESKTCLKCKQPLTCRDVPGAIPCPTTVPGFQGPHLPCCVVENDYLSGVESDPQSPTTSRPEGNQNANGYPYRDGNRPQGPYATYFTMTSPAPRFLPRFGKCNADPAPDPDPDYSLSVHESDSVYYVSDKGSVLETYQETCMMEDNTVRDFERRNCLKEDCLRSCYRPDISQPYYVKKSPITSMIDDDRLLKYIPCIRRSNTASFSRIHRKTNTNFSYNIPANTKHNNIGYNDVKMSSTRNERREDKKKCEMSTMSSRKSYEIQMNCIQKEKRFDFKEQAQRNKFKEVKSVTLSPSSSSTSCRGGGSGGCKWRRCAGRWYRGRRCKDTYQNSIGKKNNEDSDSVIENFNAEVNFNYLRETQKQPRGKGGSGMFRQRPGRHSLVPSRAPPAPRAPLAPRAPRICSAPFTSLPT